MNFKAYVSMLYSSMIMIKGMEEKVINVIFESKNEEEAIIASLKWAEDRFINTSDIYKFICVGSIKIYYFTVGKPQLSGYIIPETCIQFFEWKKDKIFSKSDYGDTNNEYIMMLLNRVKELKVM